jgi:cytidylate kinase
MNSRVGIERCLSFINCQMRNGKGWRRVKDKGLVRVVTISRQAGCGASTVAQRLAERLQERRKENEPPWTVFDKNLVWKVLEEHKLPRRLEKFMPENRISEIQDTLDELFGLHPPSWMLVRQTAETILHLANLGNVIIIGRGANIITGMMDSALHVRLVAPLGERLQHIQERQGLSYEAALEFARSQDEGRRRYLRKYYQSDINDPLLYHLVINTHLIDYERAATLIGDMVIGKEPVPRLNM